MRAMIMAAGSGERLKPLTNPLPKPMVPILNTPVMEYSVKLLRQHGIKEIIANTHYNPQYIKQYFGDGRKFDVHLSYSYEKELLGTAGGVKNNSSFLRETFFVLSGDAITNIDLSEMYKFHKSKGSIATLALTPVKNVSLYGVAVTDSWGRIKAFQEKPSPQEALSNIVNTGIYLFEPKIFDYIPNGFYDFGSQLFPKLLELGIDLFGFQTDDYWCDIGAIESYQQSHADILRIPTLLELALTDGSYKLEDSCFAGINTSKIIDLDLGENVFIGRNCQIGSGVRMDNCIVWDDTTIQDNVVINNSIIGSNCLIGMNTIIQEGTLIGSNTVIGSNLLLDKNSAIQPNSVVYAC